MLDRVESFYRGKTILLTGDTGFKGSWMALWLLKLGARVVGYALEPAGANDNYVVCNLSDRITHIDGDVRDGSALRKVFAQFEPSVAFHFAAQALVLESYENPTYTFDTNVMGTVNFLEAVRHTSAVRSAVVVTSDKCYHENQGPDGYRETDPLGGNDPYSASKGCAEIVTHSYRKSFLSDERTANVATVRAGNVIGGGDWGNHRVFPDCIRALSRNEPIVVRNPSAVRPWQHVLEPLSGYLMLGARLVVDQSVADAWNFGPLPTNRATVLDLVQETIRQWGSGSYVVDPPPDAKPEAHCLHLDTSKAVGRLNWLPALNLAETVGFAIEAYRAQETPGAAVYQQRVEQISRYVELRKKGQVGPHA